MTCECITRTNEELKDHNTKLSLTVVFGRGDSSLPTIQTEQIERGRGKPRAVALLPSYCPFCGTKYKDEMK